MASLVRLTEAQQACTLALALGATTHPEIGPWIQLRLARTQMLLGDFESAYATLMGTYARLDRIADRNAVAALLDALCTASLQTRRGSVFKRLLVERLRVFHANVDERRAAALETAIRAPLRGHFKVGVMGKGGVGKTTVSACIGSLFAELRPDVTLMDLQMPGLNGTDAIRAIRAQFADACIAVLTTYSGDARALQAVKAGARGYLLKSMLRKELISAIHCLATGKRYFPEPIASELLAAIAEDGLTPRETEVLQRTAQGLGNGDIATQLAISEDTVKGHMRSIMTKLKARNRTHAVSIALQRGIIDNWD